MAEKKKTHGRREYLKDFRTDEHGNYTYTGSLYEYSGGTEYKIRRRLIWVLAVAGAVLTVIGGCIPAKGMSNSFYVIIPYVLEISALGLFIYALARLSFAHLPLREYLFKKTVAHLPGLSVFWCVSCLAGLAAYSVYLFIHGIQDGAVFHILYMVFKALSAGIAVAMRILLKDLSFRKLPKRMIPEDDI